MEQIIVLGANGIVGRKLVQNLRAKGLSFRTAGRTSANVYFDWDDARTYHRALEGGHSLYLVPPALVAYPAPKVERLLEIARNIGIRRVVAVSSLGVAFPTEEPGSGRHHYEEVVRQCEMDWSILRPSGFMQNFSDGFMLPAIRQMGKIAAAAGHGKVAMIDSNDIASVVIELFAQRNLSQRTIALTGTHALSFAEMAAEISAACSREILYEPIDEPLMEHFLITAGVPQDYSAIVLRDQKAIRHGYAQSVTTNVQDILGRKPASFEEFARTNAQVWRID